MPVCVCCLTGTSRSRAGLNTSYVSTAGTIHEQLQRAYDGPLPFLPGPNVPTHNAIANAQIALSDPRCGALCKFCAAGVSLYCSP